MTRHSSLMITDDELVKKYFEELLNSEEPEEIITSNSGINEFQDKVKSQIIKLKSINHQQKMEFMRNS